MKGIPCNINGSSIWIKIFCLVCCVDSVARAPVQGFVQFNGSYGCNQCLHPGEWVQNKPTSARSGNIKYPLLNKVPKDRNAGDTLKHMKKAAKLKIPVFGVKNPSHLINLINFDIIFGCVPDSLHCITGIAKLFATIWFGNKQKAGLIPKKMIHEIDVLLKNMKVPHAIGRLTRTLSEKEFWKAREWENWVLYYSMPILKDVLPTEFFDHWALFVEALYILSKENIKTFEVDYADKLLHDFVARTELLYSKVSMTFNVHLLLHLSRSVYDWGPLWSHNAYAFESGNGDLLKVIHAAKGVHHQVCRRISLQYSMSVLKERVLPSASYCVRRFFTHTGTSKIQKTLQLYAHRYFGPKSTVNDSWIQKLHLSAKKTVSYKKMVKNGCLYMSAVKCNKRSDNTFAKLSNGSYVNLIYFIVDSDNKKEYVIVKRIHTIDAFRNKCSMLQKIVKIYNEESAVLTVDIVKICVHLISNDCEYLCAVPNLHSY